MQPGDRIQQQSRRAFFTSTAGGVGLAALSSLMNQDRAFASRQTASDKDDPLFTESPLAAKRPHFTPRAKNCIFIYLYGGISQHDLCDPKPKLNELDGQALPESFTKNVRFAFIQKETAKIMGSPRKFRARGQCGMEISELLPYLSTCVDDLALIRSMHTDVFNHIPGEMTINTGIQFAGHPSVGAWVMYGLGSQSQDLPGFVVMVAGKRAKAFDWSNGFLPAVYQGVRFRSHGLPVLNLEQPAGITDSMHRSQLQALHDLNSHRYRHVRDPEIAGRIAAYETAFRMQTAAPELIDLSQETKRTVDDYGLGRENKEASVFARQCLLARRLVERDVRFVNLIHSTWDHHEGLDKGLNTNCHIVDQPIAALLRDLKRRGLLDSTLVVIATEFGRTPLADNGKARTVITGRDHHPFSFSMLMAGGGVKGGYVHGKTDEIGWGVVEDPVHVNDFHATLLHLLGLDHLQLTYRFQGRDFRLTDVGGNVVQKLLA